MAFPRRSFYTIQELSIQWGSFAFDIVGWALDGHFNLAVTLPPVKTAEKIVSGMVRISAADVFAMFRPQGPAAPRTMLRRIRECDAEEDAWLWITEPEGGVLITPADVLIPRAEVEAFEAAYSQSPAGVARTPAMATRYPEAKPPERWAGLGSGGRFRHDWDGFYIELCKQIHDYGLPDTQSDLVHRMRDWFESTAGMAPDESTIRKKIRTVWQKLQY